MSEKAKENITIITGLITLVSGIVLCFFGFFLSHRIENSVLVYFGQCLIYCASVLGLHDYLKHFKNAN